MKILSQLKTKKRMFVLIFMVFSIICCEKQKIEEPVQTPLIIIGDKTITVNEFLRRAEYTIRPIYCKMTTGYHKKIVLNSLIAEKLVAMEAEKDSIIKKGGHLDNYLKGREEQAMRQYYFYNEAYKNASVDSNKINRAYKMAGRTYKVKFCNLPDQDLADETEKLLREEGKSLEEIFGGAFEDGKIPETEVTFHGGDAQVVHDALFHSDVKKGEVIGPLKVSNSAFIVFKVEGWTDRMAMTETQVSQRYDDVVEKMTMDRAQEIYHEIIIDIMKGKRLEFVEATFYKLSDTYAGIYFETEKKKKESINQQMWDKELDTQKLDSLGNTIKSIKQEPFFTLDGKTWSVQDFLDELESHPLVYKKKTISKQEFPSIFRQAVADLMRDKYITEDAYKKGYNELQTVKNYKAMWTDNICFLAHKNEYMKNFRDSVKTELNQIQTIEKFMNPYIDQLQEKYSDIIEINTEEFNKIELTRIDMVAMHNQKPYPVVVPSFPIATTDSKLDYGRVLKK